MDNPDTIQAQFCRVVSAHADQVALVDGTNRLTYRELACLANSFASLLRERLNLSPGQILLAWLNNCSEFVVSYLAAVQCGAILFPLNTNWRAPELKWILDRQLPIAGLLTKQALNFPRDAISECIPAERLLMFDDPNEPPLLQLTSHASAAAHTCVRLSPDQPAVYFTSSGSTGIPKLISRSQRNVVSAAMGMACGLRLKAGLRFLSAVPFYHGNGFDNSLSLPLLSGATIVLQPQFAMSQFLESMAEHQIQVLIGSPAIFELLVRVKAHPRSLSAMEICASSGGPLAMEVIEIIRERYSVGIQQIYGASETAEIAVSAPQGGASLVPVPGVSIAIFNSEGSSLPAYEKGEIAVQGPAVANGYVGDPDGTLRAFTEGYYRTGDLGFLDADGNLTLLGRLRPMINLSGTKVDPIEIEQVLLKLAGVNACRVLSELGPQKNQILKALVAVQEGANLTREDIIGHCRQLLAEYKIPRIIKLLPALPEDGTGKDRILWGHARE